MNKHVFSQTLFALGINPNLIFDFCTNPKIKDKDICYPNCKFLTPKEKDQIKNEPHICSKFNQRVFHFNCEPNLFRCEECQNELNSVK
jgi:hypothetical protein